MSLPTAQGPGYYRVERDYADLLRTVGLPDAVSVFENPKIEVWRSIRERENCILDHDTGRLHIKRNKEGHRGVDDEAAALQLLRAAQIPSVPLVAAGSLHDRRGFLITDDLTGYHDSEKLVAGGMPFEKLLLPTAQLAAKLHTAGLHHRDLYLCHFYARTDVDPMELALMDAGRVKKLPRWFARRWLVKDLAQFVYSLQQLKVDLPTIDRWLKAYADFGGDVSALVRRAIFSKVKWIERHDTRLREREPTRNVAIDR